MAVHDDVARHVLQHKDDLAARRNELRDLNHRRNGARFGTDDEEHNLRVVLRLRLLLDELWVPVFYLQAGRGGVT